MSNLKTYENKKVVGEYVYFTYLFKPEQTFLNMFQNELGEMKMFDIGVGAGRTTGYFAKLVKDYTAIDYAKNMIDECKKRFKNNPEYKFIHCDVRDLKTFQNDEFDLVLFSYNGLDYITPQERILVINEMVRISKNGGHLVFSSHNLQSLKKLYRIEFTLKPFKLLKRVLKFFLIYFFNGPMKNYLSKKFVVINDGAHNFSLRTYYIKPSEQIEFLSSCGISDIRLFSIEDGEEITKYEDVEDDWIYYFCRVSK